MKLVLYNYWRSSASHRVRIGLHLKQLAFEYVAVNLLASAQQEADYRAINPLAQVPTLEISEDDGSVHRLTQSLPILEYLEERWPEPAILPAEPPLRARARALAEIVNSGIQPLHNLATMRAIKKLGRDEAEWVKPWIENGLRAYAALAAESALELRSAAPRFSVGGQPTLADCCLIPQLAAARRLGVDYSQHALLVEIEAHCLALPAFAAAQPDQQPDAVKPDAVKS